MVASMQESAVSTEQLTDELLAFLARVHKTTQTPVFQLAGDLELTLSQLRALFVLAHCDHEPALTELAGAIGLSAAAAGRAIDALVRAEIVSRREDPLDRRVKRLALTPHGEELLERIADARREGLREFVDRLDDAAREALSHALHLIPADAGLAPAGLQSHKDH